MNTTRIRRYAAVSATAGLTAAAVVVAPTLAAGDSGSGTTTTTTTAPKHGGPCPGGPGAGPAALRLAGAAMRPDPPKGSTPPDGGRPPRGAKGTPPTAAQRLERRATHFAAIGKPLDKSGDEVATAVRSALKDTLDARVTAGKLTQAREDAILKAWDTAERPAGDPAGPPPAAKAPGAAKGHKGRPAGRRLPRSAFTADITAFRTAVAKALGVSVDDLVQAIDAAKPAQGQAPGDEG